MRIFDNGNTDSVENNIGTVYYTKIDKATQGKEIVMEVRGTKRKIGDVTRTKNGKYQCQQCDYEASNSGHLRTHVESKHEGVRYPCDQCDYKATTEQSLNFKHNHRDFIHFSEF